jgi:hypothetical protein
MAKDWKSYERSVAKVLGQWWGWTFRRTPSSGAWATQGYNMQYQGAQDFHGDIVAPPEANFPFSVECKCYKLVEFYTHHTGNANIHEWWEQTLTDSTRVHKWPLLVMRQNSAKPLACVSGRLWAALSPETRNAFPTSTLSWSCGKFQRNVVVMTLADFVTIPAKTFRWRKQ